jgi:hypothetical protein
VTDNQASGGVSIGVSVMGALNKYAVNKKGDKVSILNEILLESALPIPEINKFHHTALLFARELRYSRLLGLDLTMTDAGEVIILEVNNTNNEINFYQMNNGPLFGDYTQEVVDYCSEAKISYCFDYSV